MKKRRLCVKQRAPEFGPPTAPIEAQDNAGAIFSATEHTVPSVSARTIKKPAGHHGHMAAGVAHESPAGVETRADPLEAQENAHDTAPFNSDQLARPAAAAVAYKKPASAQQQSRKDNTHAPRSAAEARSNGPSSVQDSTLVSEMTLPRKKPLRLCRIDSEDHVHVTVGTPASTADALNEIAGADLATRPRGDVWCAKVRAACARAHTRHSHCCNS